MFEQRKSPRRYTTNNNDEKRAWKLLKNYNENFLDGPIA